MRPRRLSHHLAAAVEEEAAAAAAAWRRIAEEVRRNQSCRIPLRVPEATPAPCRRSPLEFRCQQRCRLRQPRPQLAAAWPNWRRRQRRAAAAQTARRRDCTPTRASLLGQSACRGWSLRTALEREGRGGVHRNGAGKCSPSLATPPASRYLSRGETPDTRLVAQARLRRKPVHTCSGNDKLLYLVL